MEVLSSDDESVSVLVSMRILLTIITVTREIRQQILMSLLGYILRGMFTGICSKKAIRDYQNGNTEAIWVAQMSLDLCQQGYTVNRMAHSCNYSPVARDVQEN